MASIQKRTNGSYKITVSLGRDMKGKQILEYLTYIPKAKTPRAIEKEVMAAAHDFEKDVKEGRYLDGEKLSFEQFTERYYLPQWAKENLSQSVYEDYADKIRRWAYPVFKTMKISRIMPLHIQNIIDGMKQAGRAPKTIKRAIVPINSVFRYAYRMRIIQENPCARCELPKLKQDTALHYFTLEQAKTFLEALTLSYKDMYRAHTRIDDTGKPYNVPEYTETHRINFQYQALFNLAIFGGFRRGELVALKWNDVDFKAHTVEVKRAAAKVNGGQILKEPKTKKSARVIVMPSESMSILKEWKKIQKQYSLALGSQWQGKRGKEYDDNFIFIQLDNGGMMYLDTPNRKFHETVRRYNALIDKQIAEGTATEEDKLPKIRLHDLRHTSATLLLAEGVDIETVSHRLGHAHASTTLDIYGHPLPEMDQTAADTLERLFAGA